MAIPWIYTNLRGLFIDELVWETKLSPDMMISKLIANPSWINDPVIEVFKKLKNDAKIVLITPESSDVLNHIGVVRDSLRNLFDYKVTDNHCSGLSVTYATALGIPSKPCIVVAGNLEYALEMQKIVHPVPVLLYDQKGIHDSHNHPSFAGVAKSPEALFPYINLELRKAVGGNKRIGSRAGQPQPL